MRKLVVDKNALESEQLQDFLNEHDENRAILTDIAGMEIYAGNALTNVNRSMAVLARYPRQVLVLKSATIIIGMGYIDDEMRFDLIDWRQTRGFPDFCHAIQNAGRDPKCGRPVVAEHAESTARHIAMMDAEMPEMAKAFEDVRLSLGEDALRAIREARLMSPEDSQHAMHMFLQLASFAFANVPPKRRPRTIGEARGYWLFRSTIAIFVLMLEWAQVGGALGASAKKLRNNFVDLQYAIAASYFDGLITNDRRLQRIYEQLDFLLNAVFSNPEYPIAHAELARGVKN